MLSRIIGVALGFTFAAVTIATAITPLGPTDVWPTQLAPAGMETLAARLARLDAMGKSFAPELAPALRYQKAFLSFLASAPEASWADEMKRLAAEPGNDGTTRALRDLGKIWVARLEMVQIGEALKGFYRREIRFPEKFSLVEAELPEAVQRDPWGDPWVYQVQAPEDFSVLSGQSYQLGPTRHPKLSLLRGAGGNRKVTVPAWKIRAVSAGGNTALEFRSGASTALIQPGGMADGCTLVYIGQGWALMAQVDQLFTVPF